MVVLKNSLEEGLIRSLAKQVFPTKERFTPHSSTSEKPLRTSTAPHLVPHRLTPDQGRLRTSIYKNEQFETFALASAPKEVGFELDQSGYIPSRD